MRCATDENDISREYANDEITVLWLPEKCIHVKWCWEELESVFDPDKRPWIDMKGASTERIIQQVEKCPSGALSFKYNNFKKETQMKETKAGQSGTVINVMPNGPLIVKGNFRLKDKEGNSEDKEDTVAFCRCGASKKQPYCDGTHSKINFKG